MFHRGSKKRTTRTGAALAAVLVCVAVAVVLGAALTSSLVVHHRQLQLSHQQQQSFWLAESAVQRTRHRLKSAPDYAGETWQVPANVLGAVGVVVVQVDKVTEPQPGWLVRVVSRFPDHPKHRVIFQRELFVAKPEPDAATPDAATPNKLKPEESLSGDFESEVEIASAADSVEAVSAKSDHLNGEGR